MVKIDLKQDLKHLYQASPPEPVILEVPAMNFLMLDGAGGPHDSPPFQEAAEVLFRVSYTLKLRVKKEKAVDYRVMPLEGLWDAEDPAPLSPDRKDRWQWTLMIMQPELVTSNAVRLALEQVAKKQNPPALARVKFLRYREGLAAQLTHVGPYRQKGPAVSRLHGFIRDRGYQLRGKHHEIYLSDPRRTAPERLKTIIRQPVS
jgi:hypothetical protein